MSYYGTLEQVSALTRHLLQGQATFDDSTVPTKTDVEAIMTQVTGVLDMALAAVGITTPITSTDALAACSYFVVRHTSLELRYAYPHLGVAIEEDSQRPDPIAAAHEFAAQNAAALKALGEGALTAASEGLEYTGLLTREYRADPDDTTREQPKFWRGQFDVS